MAAAAQITHEQPRAEQNAQAPALATSQTDKHCVVAQNGRLAARDPSAKGGLPRCTLAGAQARTNNALNHP